MNVPETDTTAESNRVVHDVELDVRALRDIEQIDESTAKAAISWAQAHASDLLAYRNNGMKIYEITDTVLSTVTAR